MKSRTLLLTSFLISTGFYIAPIHAQTVTGTPGSPSATTTIDGRYLPNPPEAFGGEINLSAKDSKPYWPPQIVPPKGAPNILLIMTDDAGYGVSGTFGGVIPTPALDRIAQSGLRYTQFNSTALCSPTRAALITGRNHHSSGFGVISEQATGYPGYDSVLGVENATIGNILKQNGYATSWFGKNHNTPSFQYSSSGPFDQWPSGMGFDYFYGFMGGDTNQWQPYLFQDHTQIFPWVGKPSYNLITDEADNAINHIKQLNASAPDKPFFVYYVPGATHAPHHPTPEWIEKFKGKFDNGWNAMRDEIFANQKRLGVIPQNTLLTAWPDDLPKWETLDPESKKLFARQAEVFAAYVAYSDNEIGRVIQAVEDVGKLDNTLIIYIEGDNGTSAEGSTLGTPSELITIEGLTIPVAEQMKFYDAWGSDQTYPHMSVAWSWAFDTPFKWTKQVASHFGGTRQGMAMSWPARIKDAGGVRNQFHHVIDIVPTILAAAGIPAPMMVNGVAQKPIEGVSMAYTWDKANAEAPSARQTQYFEMFGNRGIYHGGWYACTTPPAAPWLMGQSAMPEVVNGYKWELYNLAEDFSQANDLAAVNPDKLNEMQELFLLEAAKYGVFPLDNSILERLVTPRPSATAGRNVFSYSGVISGLPGSNAPNIVNKSYTITAEIEVPADGTEGMIVTTGGKFAGYGLYLLKGKPVFLYNFMDMERFRWEGSDVLAPGKHTIVFDFKSDGPGMAKGGSGVLTVDGKEVASQKIPHTVPALMPWDETFDVGLDTRTGVEDKDYRVPFEFTGTIDKLTVQLN
ncbi:arylsulfatase [Rhizobium ruizarguesonis]|uniref:arylsulfatase n=1 Tax=Rhizobium ruizarguesonis TaxID=2081791 RepID=UPI00102FCEBD|nr:arylsulfatase [Rhizobium ruizarguesonis]TAV14822.1 arylsulfatase [Rhizobium ruizarguesonis]TAV27284.1 arylsulfatase [Rhizobium ruizarguesonis]TAW71265.1 arylsulfatase [Rhizobium ruizarguesonis]TAW92651.1 arylsulfatase [Rhizobium ruizarguesonis]TAY45898.1 arylsulfatase [Rhizobium ruizarguesonis]